MGGGDILWIYVRWVFSCICLDGRGLALPGNDN
jgi:hypothetical protein